jgi:uncharacterized protein YkwD
VQQKIYLILSTFSLIAALITAPSAPAAGIGKGRAFAPRHGRATKSDRDQADPLIAPPAVCPNQSRLDAPAPVQEQAMLCMANFARGHLGLESLTADTALAQSAAAKAGDILGCDAFSHFACGRPFYYWMGETGYLSEQCWWAGENIAWGEGDYGSVGSIFKAWTRSPSHRDNLLSGFEDTGVSLRVGTLEGRRGVHVWVQHFGAFRCAASAA